MISAVSRFASGSAWAMARDIASGHVLVSERTFFRFDKAQMDRLAFEMERRLREVRSEQPPLDDIDALRRRNVAIQRLSKARTVLGAYRRKRRL